MAMRLQFFHLDHAREAKAILDDMSVLSNVSNPYGKRSQTFAVMELADERTAGEAVKELALRGFTFMVTHI